MYLNITGNLMRAAQVVCTFVQVHTSGSNWIHASGSNWIHTSGSNWIHTSGSNWIHASGLVVHFATHFGLFATQN